MQGKTIATIYFFLISAGSIVLMVIGIFNAVNFLINSTQFEQYPLRYNAISNCDSINSAYPFNGPGPTSVKITQTSPSETTPSAAEIQKARDICLQNEDLDRKQHRVDDIKNALTFSIIGFILFIIHFPEAKKHSKS